MSLGSLSRCGSQSGRLVEFPPVCAGCLEWHPEGGQSDSTPRPRMPDACHAVDGPSCCRARSQGLSLAHVTGQGVHLVGESAIHAQACMQHVHIVGAGAQVGAALLCSGATEECGSGVRAHPLRLAGWLTGWQCAAALPYCAQLHYYGCNPDLPSQAKPSHAMPCHAAAGGALCMPCHVTAM